MTRKRRLEAVEAITGKPDMNPPILMSDEDMLFWYALINDALDAKANASIKNSEPMPRAGNKSKGRLELEAMIFRVADRLKNAPKPPLALQAIKSPFEVKPQANAEDEPPELLLARLLKKVDRKH
jgi:hypothetical protein